MGIQSVLFNPVHRMKFLVFFGLLALASANIINKVEIKVKNCRPGLDGDIDLLVDGQDDKSCNTGWMRHDAICTKFQENPTITLDGKEGETGMCTNFDLGDTNKVSMTITHQGNTGIKIEWVKVYADNGNYNCDFSHRLDGNDHEGKNCKFDEK